MKRLFPSLCLQESGTSFTTQELLAGEREWKMIMMRQVAWLVLFAYSLMLVKPVIPVFMDVLAHTFWEQQHLLTVHEEHGKFHMHYEVSKAGGHQPDKERVNAKYEVEKYYPAISIPCPSRNQFSIVNSACSCFLCFFSFFLPDSDNPPPRAIS